jgi:acyl-CoA thioester hydrolase
MNTVATKTPSSHYLIRFSDCDLYGHLNNARFLDYFLNAREDHLKDYYGVSLTQFYKEGTGWLIWNHEICYLRPAVYNERVCITTLLLQATPTSLLVEMLMTDEPQTHIKALLWTTFVPIDNRTGKRSQHPQAFMEFAKAVEVPELDVTSGIKARLSALKEKFKA